MLFWQAVLREIDMEPFCFYRAADLQNLAGHYLDILPEYALQGEGRICTSYFNGLLHGLQR